MYPTDGTINVAGSEWRSKPDYLVFQPPDYFSKIPVCTRNNSNVVTESCLHRKCFSRTKPSIIRISATNYLLLRSSMFALFQFCLIIFLIFLTLLLLLLFWQARLTLATPPTILEWKHPKVLTKRAVMPKRVPGVIENQKTSQKAWPKKLTEYLLMPKVYVCSMRDDLLLQHKQ